MSFRFLTPIFALMLVGGGCAPTTSAVPAVTPSGAKNQPATAPSVTDGGAATAGAASGSPPITTRPAGDDAPTFVPPLARAGERITKKPFGIHITPQNSPVSPERFSGYHTGTDFETFPDEADTDVLVFAVCTGALLRAAIASGYGGYAVQSCRLNGQDVTVVYGHLRLASMRVRVGDALAAGEPFAVLGKGFSAETDGERKHLHLGIHRGTAVNIRGYVSATSGLADWMDAGALIGK